MLTELAIRNFAIIDELRLDFAGGFNVLTGETGAGKSILVDALGMVLGDKAHAELVRTGADEARIEAVFDGCGGDWGGLLEARGVPPPEEGRLFLQRRIGREGRHQAYVNGAAVPLAFLADTGARLVDIHGQHQHQTLLKVANHLDILDDYGGLAGQRREFGEHHRRLIWLEAKIARATEDRMAREQRRDLLAFQAREIESAGLSPGDETALERDRSLMVNAEKINQLLREALDLLYEGDTAAAGQTESAVGRLEGLARHLPEAAAAAADLKGAAVVLGETADTLKGWLERAEYDPERHNQVEERLAAIGRLKRKYGSSVEEILDYGEKVRAELSELTGADSLKEEWTRERAEILGKMADAGRALGRAREKVAVKIEKEVEANLAELGMEKARFAVRLSPCLDPAGPLEIAGARYRPWEGGLEEAEFLLSANPGEDLKSLVRVASGGELSRIMLAIKTAVARVDRVTSLIFDEIDAGIGGAVARTVGRKLRQLSAERQVICVTHLPQIASLADAHFVVTKRLNKGKARVGISRLGAEERVGEIARMIAGEAVTKAAEQHARELMEG